MAFSSRIGSLVKQTVAHSGMSSGPASMLGVIRAMSSTKLFVGGLSWGTDDQTLRDAFTNFGDVVEARVITDRDTGRSRGFGFVNFASTEDATAALGMDGKELNGRNIRVNYANDRPSGGFRGGYGGGGYGGGNYGGGGSEDFGTDQGRGF